MGAGASKKVPQQVNFHYKNGKPQFQGTAVFPMFNMMLYRIADKTSKRWAFYNDSQDMIIHIAILFDYDSQVKPLGTTTGFRIDDPEEGCEDDFGKFLCEVDVRPGETQMFVEGDITGWRVDTLEARTEEDERVFRL